jgi:hypothetical protein
MPDTRDNGRNPFLIEAAPWIRGKNVSLYLHGRDKPITGLTVKHIGHHVLIARWNNSTHIIPADKIAFIRFSPDNDPCRDVTSPLHATVNNRKPFAPPIQGNPPPANSPSPRPEQTNPAAPDHDHQPLRNAIAHALQTIAAADQTDNSPPSHERRPEK